MLNNKPLAFKKIIFEDVFYFVKECSNSIFIEW